MPHAFAPDHGMRNFHTAFITDNAFVADLFIFAAITLPILGWTEYFFAEKPVFFRLLSPVIYCLWLGYFAMRPIFYYIRGSKFQSDTVKLQRLCLIKYHVSIS